MKIKYDRRADAMKITLSDKPSDFTREVNGLVNLRMTADGTVVGIELLRASWYVTDPENVDFTAVGEAVKR